MREPVDHRQRVLHVRRPDGGAQLGGGFRRDGAFGLATFEENDTSCCYALQDRVWVTGPGKVPREVYVVKAGARTLQKADAAPDVGCATTACCTSDEQDADPAQTPAEAKAAAACACRRS